MKKVLMLYLSLIWVLLSGCSAKQAAPSEAYDVGLLISSLDNPFFTEMKEGAVREAERLGLSLEVLNAENDVVTERQHIQKLIGDGVKVMIINPVDAEASLESVQLAKDEGISVITIDRDLAGDVSDVFIASDNITGGQMAAHHLSDLLGGKGNVLILEGIIGTSANSQRVQGFMEALDTNDVSVAVVASADFDREKASEVVRVLLESGQRIDGILACNDEMALGAVDVVAEHGSRILVVGFDGTDEAVKAVFNGFLAGTVGQKPEKMAATALKTAERLMAGEQPEREMLMELEMIKVGN